MEASEENTTPPRPGNEVGMEEETPPDAQRIEPERPLHNPPFQPTEHFLQYYGPNSEPNIDLNLPIAKFHSEILDTVALNQVTIISGSTGCGKTTQVPQYILDWYAIRKLHCNIIVIQPRRVCATAVAERVCDERGWKLGTICGFKVGLNNGTSVDTRLTYVTTGIFLQSLLHDIDLSEYTHIIFDEVHEREQRMDFCLCVVKPALKTIAPNTKVILMSATADVYQFADYFSTFLNGNIVPAPVVNVSAKLNHHVDIYYLDDLELLGELPKLCYEYPNVSKKLMTMCIYLLAQLDLLDYDRKKKFAVLIFLPGVAEIETMYNLIKLQTESPCGQGYNWVPIPTHSSLSPDEQAEVFLPAPDGSRKIVIGTNIAESSITIPDVSVVIDFCLTKVLVTDRNTNLTRLKPIWTSKANLEQRAGRVGRVADGIVYRLIPQSFIENDIQNYNPPDIKRCLLEKTILYILLFTIKEPRLLLAEALDPPEEEDLKITMFVLKELGAVPLVQRHPKSPVITYLGRLMAVLPIEVRYTRLILFGYVFGVFEECVIIAAGMSHKGLLFNSFRQRMRFYHKKLEWADGSASDSICVLNIYRTWKQLKATGYFQTSPAHSEDVWAKNNFVDLGVLREVDKLVRDLTLRLRSYGFEETTKPEEMVKWYDWEKEFILKLVLSGTFYPNYFRQLSVEDSTMEMQAVVTLSGRDPFRTALMKNFPRKNDLMLYADELREYMSECGDDFEITTNYSRKVFFEFPRNSELLDEDSDTPFDPTIPGGISMGVYKAHKLRFIRNKFQLTLLSSADSIQERREEIRARRKAEEVQLEPRCVPKTATFESSLPSADKTDFPVKLTHILNPNDFWCIIADPKGLKTLRVLNHHLNTFRKKLETFSQRPKKGQVCVVKDDDGKLLRGKILVVLDSKEPEQQGPREGQARRKRRLRRKKTNRVRISWQAKVFLFDTGETRSFQDRNIMKCSVPLFKSIEKIPALAFPCTLTSVRASPYINASGKWTEEGIEAFRYVTKDSDLSAAVYSIVSGVTSVDLYKMVQRREGVDYFHINTYLVDMGFAIQCKECWLSEKYHRIKNGERRLDDSEIWAQERYTYGYLEDDVDGEYNYGIMYEWPITLIGPESPLEMNLRAYPLGKVTKSVSMNGSSVNSVILNPYSRDMFARLCVAGTVSQSCYRNSLVLNELTMMPNIPGWAWIIPLLFTPCAEYRVDEVLRKYKGAVCGLGLDGEGRIMYPDNDIEMVFDVDITQEDAVDINIIRYLVSKVLYAQNGLDHAERFTCKGIIQKCVRSLLFKKREAIPFDPSDHGAHTWHATNVNIQDDEVALELESLVFRPHIIPDLNGENFRDYLLSLDRVQDLIKYLGEGSPLIQHILGMQ